MDTLTTLPDPLYADPQAYDIAFGWDSFDETRALLDIAGKRLGRPPLRALDIGCGTGRVLRDLARLDLEAIGLDHNADLLRFARRRLGELGLTGETVHADMRDFRLDRPADVAFNAINGVGYLTGDGDLLRHLQAVADNLTAGGVYVVELSFGPIETDFLGRGEPWAFERDNVRVMADWRLLEVDQDTGLVINEASLIVSRPGQPERRIVCRHEMRKWDQPEFYAAVADSPLALVDMRRRDLKPVAPETPLTYADDNVFVFLQK